MYVFVCGLTHLFTDNAVKLLNWIELIVTYIGMAVLYWLLDIWQLLCYIVLRTHVNSLVLPNDGDVWLTLTFVIDVEQRVTSNIYRDGIERLRLFSLSCYEIYTFTLSCVHLFLKTTHTYITTVSWLHSVIL